MRKSLLFLFSVVFLYTNIMWGGTTGKLTGKVTDSSTGDALPFVNITIEGTVMGAATDLDGNYVILNLSPGRYSVKVQYIGYQTKTIENVSISIDLTTKLDVVLTPTSVELGEVVVQAQMGGIKKDVTSSQSSISAESIENLPVAEIDDVLQLQAGVSRDANGDFHIRGGRTNEITYQLNGISITDSYDNSRGIEIDNSSVQELQVISGTFNAEYGNALSGVINTVTKEGGSKFHGNIKVYSSDYLSNHDKIFNHIDDFNPIANYNLQGSLSGPVPFAGNRLKFFGNARYTYDDGYLYGKRVFNTDGSTGNGDYVAMNYSKRYMGIANISWVASSSFKFNMEMLLSDEEYKDYGHDWKYNPDGDVTKFDNSITTTITMTHTFSSSAFYTLKGSYFKRTFDEYLYENPLDSRYIHPDSTNRVGYAFISGGTNNHQFNRGTETWLAKLDYSSQLNENHLIKVGAEIKTHKLTFDDYNVEPKLLNDVPVEPFEPAIPSVLSPNRDKYENSPIDASAYFQDKIEYNDVIINIGLRLDYFDSKGQILVDPTDPNIYAPLRPGMEELSIAEREPLFYKDAKPKLNIGPRFGIAYPISAEGVIHFSYGHFLQIPPFQYLFNGGKYKVPNTGSSYGPYGNPDIEPQKTIMYEIGFRQEFMGSFLIDATLFYRDIRDWITAGPFIRTINGIAYSIYTNKDYSNVKGVTVSFNKNFSNNYGLDVNYTYQVAEGSNSTPEQEFYAQQGNDEPTLYLIPLDWDQRHQFNASLYVGDADWGVSLLGRYGTGLPYTPSITQFTAERGLTSGFQRNVRRRPDQFNLDLKVNKSFDVFGYNLNAFIRVFNLLDTKTVVNVFADTGDPSYTTEAQNVGEDANRPNSVEEYLTRPWNYVPPRLVQLGFDIEF
ncbi:MAG: TonB-dependent receptor [Bacteroidetes bacterium]|nr:TonB-dependent receptor [Bacteroidota bacterium]